MRGMKKYKDIYAAKGSALYEALCIPDEKERSKAAKKAYDLSNEAYKKLYSEEDREWFRIMSGN